MNANETYSKEQIIKALKEAEKICFNDENSYTGILHAGSKIFGISETAVNELLSE